jgi:diguanylate cyclase (GGDEF)-like protein/PAS domain S-box-containing protein
VTEGWDGLDAEAHRALFFHSLDGVVFTDPDSGQILAANPASCELLARTEGELRHLAWDGVVDPQDSSRWDAAWFERVRAGVFRGELSFLRGDGTTLIAEVTSGVFADSFGALRNCFILRDVSEQKAADAAQRQSDTRFRRLIETSSDAFIAMNVEGQITEWNRQAEIIFGWSRDEILGRRLVDTVVPPKYRDAHTRGFARYLATGQSTVGRRLELEGRRRDGREFPVELTIWTLDEPDGEVQFNALLHDVSERRRLEEELWELALVDDLTGLHNRRAFVLLAEQALREAARASRPAIAVFADVDHLKVINDSLGHPEGDRALRLVADALRSACRTSDIIGRLGGDEFAIVLTEAHEIDGIEGRIRHHLAQADWTSPLPLSVSIGVVRCDPTPDYHLDDLIAQADRAMYEDRSRKRQSQEPTSSPEDAP